MLKRIIIFAIGIISLTSLAQENQNEFTTIFKDKNDQSIDHGGYGAISFGYTNIDDKDALQVSLRGAWLINHKIALGFAGYGFANNLQKTSNKDDYYLAGGYGGFYFEPIFFSNYPVHVSFPIIIGGGGISTIPKNYWDIDYDDFYYDYDAFFVFEPGVELEFNMVEFFRIGLGASYRFTNGVLLNYPLGKDIPTDVLNTFNVYLNFKFGKF